MLKMVGSGVNIPFKAEGIFIGPRVEASLMTLTEDVTFLYRACKHPRILPGNTTVSCFLKFVSYIVSYLHVVSIPCCRPLTSLQAS